MADETDGGKAEQFDEAIRRSVINNSGNLGNF